MKDELLVVERIVDFFSFEMSSFSLSMFEILDDFSCSCMNSSKRFDIEKSLRPCDIDVIAAMILTLFVLRDLFMKERDRDEISENEEKKRQKETRNEKNIRRKTRYSSENSEM
jgi:hypothetical protein